MATMQDVDELALAMPQATKEVSEDGRPTYLVHGKMFCFHRRPTPGRGEMTTGERLDDVFVLRVEDLEVKELLLADRGASSSRRRTGTGYAASADPHPGPRAPRPRRARELVSTPG